MPTFSLTCECASADAELALGAWSCRGMLGCEETPGSTHDVRLTAWFRDEAAATAALHDLGSAELQAAGEIRAVEDRDWNAAWRATMQPAKVAERLWVSPPWLPPPLGEGDAWIRIEPQMAFGTGHHESTRLAAQSLLAAVSTLMDARVLDVGCGSGVLCFAAGIAGARAAVGVEIDRDCAGNLAENRRANHGTGRAAFVIGTLDSLRAAPCFDVAAMNMILTEARPCLQALARLLKQGGTLVWSGLLTGDRAAAVAAAADAGLSLVRTTNENEWTCCTFTRATSGDRP